MQNAVAYRERRNFHQVWGAGVPDRPFLNRDDVAAIGSRIQGGEPLKPKTISEHLYQSQPLVGGRTGNEVKGKYADDPFPAPDGRQGKAPWWLLERQPEIEAWFERHPRRSKGDGIGGRPRRTHSNG